MTYKPGKKNLKYIVENLYHAISGEKPDEKKKQQLYAGVEGMLRLYEENPNVFYATAAVALLEGTAKLRLQSGLAEMVMKYVAQSLAKKAGYDLKNNPQGGQ